MPPAISTRSPAPHRPVEETLATVLELVAAAPDHLGATLDDQPEPLIAFTAERRILAANPSAERFFGYERRGLDGRPTDVIVPERLRQPDAPPQLATVDLTTIEIPGLRSDGSEIATVWTYGFAPGPDGPIFVLTVQDRAKRSLELDALRRSDARYHALLVAALDVVWFTDANGRVVEPQPAWQAFTGQSFAEARGEGWSAAVHADDRERLLEDWNAALRTGAEYRSVGRVWSAKHAGYRAIQARAVPVRDGAGAIREWVGTLADVQDSVDALERHARRERELEDRFRAVFANALDGIMLTDDELRVVDVNPAGARLLGRSCEDLVGARSVDLMPPADRDLTPERLEAFRASGVMTGEGAMLRPDGTVRRAEFGAVANVSPGVHLTIFRDIEDRKRAEENQRFLDDVSFILAASLDFDETLASVVRLAVPRIADWAAVDMLVEGGGIRRVALAHVDPDKIELATELRRRQEPSIHDPNGVGAVVRTGKPELVELVTDELLSSALASRPDVLAIVRSLALVSAMTVPLSARGRVIGAISFVAAESRRRYGPADLAFAQELARRATYAVENAMFVRDLRAANETKDLFLRRAEHLQATATQLVGADSVAEIARIFHAADRAFPLGAHACSLYLRVGEELQLVAATADFEATALRWSPHAVSADTPLAIAARTGTAQWLPDSAAFHARFPHLPGSERFGGRAAIPLGAGSEGIGVLGVLFGEPRAFDANERAYLTAVANLWAQALQRARLAEAERDAIRRALEAETLGTRKKDEFLAMLGHELRNPLAPIVTATSLIRVRGRASSRELDVLERQARHLVRLVDDLLDISRVASGKLSLDRRSVDLADALAQAIESTAPRFDEKRIRLFTEVTPTPLVVDGDRDRLVQVVTNVLVNAAKFTPAAKAVHLSARADGGEAVVVVRDEGEGIAPELLPQVFDLFTQGPQGQDRSSGGLGLGLAIARSIVAAHGGRIDVASEGPGAGATFTIRLPLLASTATDVAPQATFTAAAPGARRVLIVDDNADSAEMLACFLAEVGYEPFVAGDAGSALALARRARPHAAILDIGLPDADGYELARSIRSALGDDAPALIALTGYAQSSDRDRALDSGFVEHMAKPVDVSRLALTLRTITAKA